MTTSHHTTPPVPESLVTAMRDVLDDVGEGLTAADAAWGWMLDRGNVEKSRYWPWTETPPTERELVVPLANPNTPEDA